MSGRATIGDVARSVGVAPSTVSRAFNAPHRLRPETVVRIVEAAERLGYVPNTHARALHTTGADLIGLIVPDITNPFFPPLVRAAQQAAETHGFSVLLAETNSVAGRERSHIASLSRVCRGLIVASSRLTPEELRQVARRTRVVLINTDAPGTARVLMSAAAALQTAVERLSDAGAIRLLYVGGPARTWADAERRDAIARGARQYGLCYKSIPTRSGSYREARDVVTRDPWRGDAVIAFDDVVAFGVMDGLAELGLRVPGQVAVIGCDDALPIQTRPQLSTIKLRTAEGARRAVRLIADATDAPLADQRLVLEGDLRWRETTKALTSLAQKAPEPRLVNSESME